tara:strand:+ start:446 stop:718 length:273 start_codon:yes stop_codon:yes gene_type:complete
MQFSNKYYSLWGKSFIYIFIFYLTLGLIFGNYPWDWNYPFGSLLFYSFTMSLMLGILFPLWSGFIIISIKFLRVIFTMIDDYLESRYNEL